MDLDTFIKRLAMAVMLACFSAGAIVAGVAMALLT